MKVINLIILFISILFIKRINGESCTRYSDVNSKSTDPTTCGITSTDPCITITDSILSCGNDYKDIVLILSPGTFKIEKVTTFGTITNKSITIVNSLYTTTVPLPEVIIDLSNSIDSFIHIVPLTPLDLTSVQINGITFINGNQLAGSVILLNGTGLINLQINQSTFINNKVTNGYGGTFGFFGDSNIPISNSSSSTPGKSGSVVIQDSSFTDTFNSDVRGGVFYNGGLDINFTFNNCLFSNLTSLNTTFGSIGYMNLGYLTITNTIIKYGYSKTSFYITSINNDPLNNSNSSSGNPSFYFKNVTYSNSNYGIGFTFFKISTTTQFDSCTFTNNINSSPINLFQSGSTSFNNCIFSSNSNNFTLNQLYGGGITITSSTVSIVNSTFISNRSPYGGSIYISYSPGVFHSTPVSIIGCKFENNTNPTGNSSSIVNENNDILVIQNTVFNENSVNSIYCSQSSIYLSNVTVTLNNKSSNKINPYGIECGILTGSCDVINIDTKKSYFCNEEDNYYYGKPNGLSPAQKAGISIGVIAAFILIVIGGVIIIRKYKQSKQYKPIGL